MWDCYRNCTVLLPSSMLPSLQLQWHSHVPVYLWTFTLLFSDVLVVSDLNKNIGGTTDLARKGTDRWICIPVPLFTRLYAGLATKKKKENSQSFRNFTDYLFKIVKWTNNRHQWLIEIVPFVSAKLVKVRWPFSQTLLRKWPLQLVLCSW